MNLQITVVICSLLLLAPHTCTVCAMPLLRIGSTHVLFVATRMNSLQCTLFVATPMNSLQCTLFVATTMNLEYTCTVCGHKHYFVYNHISVYYFCMCKLVYTSPGGGEESPRTNHSD